jgi:hypothetical protein
VRQDDWNLVSRLMTKSMEVSTGDDNEEMFRKASIFTKPAQNNVQSRFPSIFVNVLRRTVHQASEPCNYVELALPPLRRAHTAKCYVRQTSL